ncbi:hypothetical protein HDF16_006133 [Granulicella aggregans]|uniref:Uncharacterized protein n=1 Tax=Granulicella aggregans TaxID=474949 RepID=A0A7W8E771_9BACT|nr:hypothetical protein [Granulicella aggregans]
MFIGIFGVLIATWILITLRRSRKRKAAIKELASGIDFKFLDTTLPRDLDGSGKVLARSSSFSNVIEGVRYGVRVIAFDGSVGAGGYSWERTYIAISSIPSVLPEWCQGLEAENSGEWAILFRSPSYYFRSLMPVSELGLYLEKL